MFKMYYYMILIIISQISLNDGAHVVKNSYSQYKMTMKLLKPYMFNYKDQNSEDFKNLGTLIETYVDQFFSRSSVAKMKAFQLMNVNDMITPSQTGIKVECILLVDEKDTWAAAMLDDYDPEWTDVIMKRNTLKIFVWEPVSATYMSKFILTTHLATCTLPQRTREELKSLLESVMEAVDPTYDFKINYMYFRTYMRNANIYETAAFMKIEIFSLVRDVEMIRSEIEAKLKETPSGDSVNSSTAEVVIWETERKKYRSAMVVREKYDVEYKNKHSLLYMNTLAAINKGYQEIFNNIDIYTDFKSLNDIRIEDISDYYENRSEIMFISVLEVDHRSSIVDFHRKIQNEISNLNRSRSFSGKETLPGSQILNEIKSDSLAFALSGIEYAINLQSDILNLRDIEESIFTLFQHQPENGFPIRYLAWINNNTVELGFNNSLYDMYVPLKDLLTKQEATGVFGNNYLVRGAKMELDYYVDNWFCPTEPLLFCDPNNTSENRYCPSRRCDNKQHCSNLEDEKHCDVTPNHFFKCDDGTHIFPERVCNGMLDCLDHSDEVSCPLRCVSYDPIFFCNDKTKICPENICNGIKDCRDGEDELMCSYKNSTCNAVCKNNSGKCCTYCDGIYECEDGSDELNCPHPTSCKHPDIYRCENSDKIICSRDLCDNYFDCEQKDDELKNCDTCPIGYTRCEMLDHSVSCVKLCDDIFECKDGSDEILCPTTPCTLENYYQCDNGKIICGEQKCDGIFDCSNLKDELLCDICPPGFEKCDPSNITEPCIKRCDGLQDCPNGSDESNCLMGQGCKGQGKFVCRNGAEICPEYICDGIKDCPDGEDEQYCR